MIQTRLVHQDDGVLHADVHAPRAFPLLHFRSEFVGTLLALLLTDPETITNVDNF